jgi:hypothetical protein
VETNMSKYTIIKSKYLADGLAFCGFHYQKYQDDGVTVYSFEETDKLKEVIYYMTKVRKENQDNNK